MALYKFIDSKYRNWTQAQLNILLNEYKTISIESLSIKLNKNKSSIYYILNKENLDFKERIYWTEQEILLLKNNYLKFSNKELCEILHHSKDSIKGKMTKLKLPNRIKRLNKEELKIIESMANSEYKFTYADIATKLNLNTKQVALACQSRGWTQKIKRMASNGADTMICLLRNIYGPRNILTEFHIGEYLRLDGYLPSKYIGFEYDGQQHFAYTPHFHETKEQFEHQLKRDNRKNELCNSLGINLIRIRYDEELNESLLINKIETIGNGKGTQILNTYHKYGGYKAKSTIEYQERSKQKSREWRKAQYEKQKEWKKTKEEKDVV